MRRSPSAEWRAAASLAARLMLATAIAGALAPLAAQSGESGMPDLRAMIAAADARIHTACPSDHPDDRSALLAGERRIAATVNGADATTWLRLGCARALLYSAQAIAHAGPLMVLGDSWHKGAIRSLLEALDRDPAHDQAAELLGELMLDENVPPERERATAALVAAVDGGVRGARALRGCTELSRRSGDRAAELRCARAALDAGVDSTWQLLQLAWAAFDAADTTSGQQLFNGALAAAHDSTAWSEVGWHLRWFLEPDEEAAWRGLPDSARAAWVRDRFASRDVRDGRAPGSRMAEHFERLTVVDSSFRTDVPVRSLGRFAVAAMPDNDLGDGWVAGWGNPAVIPAQAFRYFRRTHPRYDDRAEVWMRWGAPTSRIPWSGSISLPSARRSAGRCDSGDTTGFGGGSANDFSLNLCHPLGTHTNVREAWAYQVDGAHLLLNFEGEQFDGSVGATRLVAGVLGQYLCDVDSYRCRLTNRSSSMGLPLEKVAELRFEDENIIREATTKDDNSVRVEHPISVVAQLSRIWDPRTGAPLAVIPYAIKVGDVERTDDSTGITATIALTLRQWDPVKVSWQATDVIRRLRLPDKLRKSSHLTGYLVTPTSTGVSAWSLIAQQGDDRRGRAWEDDKPALGADALRLSDLILGAPSQGSTGPPRPARWCRSPRSAPSTARNRWRSTGRCGAPPRERRCPRGWRSMRWGRGARSRRSRWRSPGHSRPGSTSCSASWASTRSTRASTAWN